MIGIGVEIERGFHNGKIQCPNFFKVLAAASGGVIVIFHGVFYRVKGNNGD